MHFVQVTMGLSFRFSAAHFSSDSRFLAITLNQLYVVDLPNPWQSQWFIQKKPVGIVAFGGLKRCFVGTKAVNCGTGIRMGC